MITFLDKTIKVKTILIGFGVILLWTVAVYVYLLLKQGLLQHNPGVYSLNSPYVKLFPEECKKYTAAVTGGFRAESNMDIFLLKEKYKRIKINNPDLDYATPSHMTCLGYTVIGGLHETSIGAANFTHHYTDAAGASMVTVKVEYHQEHKYIGRDLMKELKEFKELNGKSGVSK